MAKLLSIGQDAGLLYSRNLVLQRSGADVHGASLAQALQLIEAEFFGLIVLCHSLEPAETVHICHVVERFWPRSRVLLIAELACDPLPECGFDAVLPWHLGPDALLRSVGAMLRGDGTAFSMPVETDYRIGPSLCPLPALKETSPCLVHRRLGPERQLAVQYGKHYAF